MSLIDRLWKLRVGSTKPYWVTTRDALIITCLSTLVTVIMYLLWCKFTRGSTADVWSIATQTAAGTFILQFGCEYLGLNAMILESSLRYAKGTPLGNFITTRSAMIYNVRNRLCDAGQDAGTAASNLIDTRMRTLVLCLDAPLVKIVKKHIADPMDVTMAAVGTKATPEDVQLLLALGEDGLRGAQVLMERITEDITRYILTHGQSAFALAKGQNDIPEAAMLAVKEYALEYYKKELMRPAAELAQDYGPEWQEYLEKKIRKLGR